MLLSHLCVFGWIRCIQGRIQRFWKGGVAICRPPWLADEKILALRWSKKSKITFETLRFWWNISISILKCLHFYAVKVCWWDLINFSKIYRCFDKERKKHSHSSQWEKKNWEKWTLSYNRLIYKALQNNNHYFFSQAHSQRNFRFLLPGWRKKHQNGKLGTANS